MAGALAGQFGDEQGDHLVGQGQAAVEHFQREQVPGPPVPAFAFACRADGHGEEPVALFAVAATVAFFDVGADRDGGVA
jgi:hypothetical protein